MKVIAKVGVWVVAVSAEALAADEVDTLGKDFLCTY